MWLRSYLHSEICLFEGVKRKLLFICTVLPYPQGSLRYPSLCKVNEVHRYHCNPELKGESRVSLSGNEAVFCCLCRGACHLLQLNTVLSDSKSCNVVGQRLYCYRLVTSSAVISLWKSFLNKSLDHQGMDFTCCR